MLHNDKNIEIIDISQPVFSAKVYNGDTVPSTTTRRTIEQGYRLTDVTMCLHNSTHIDAPSHYIEDGCSIDAVDLHKCMGRCYLLRHNGDITAQVINDLVPEGVERLLLDGKCLIVPDGAQAIVERGIVLVGIGRASVASQHCCTEVHRILLQNSIVIVEGLSMREVAEGYYKLYAFPVKFEGCEASPVRAILTNEQI